MPFAISSSPTDKEEHTTATSPSPQPDKPSPKAQQQERDPPHHSSRFLFGSFFPFQTPLPTFTSVIIIIISFLGGHLLFLRFLNPCSPKSTDVLRSDPPPGTFPGGDPRAQPRPHRGSQTSPPMDDGSPRAVCGRRRAARRARKTIRGRHVVVFAPILLKSINTLPRSKLMHVFNLLSHNNVEATPKTIMRTMGVKGLTLFHLKSHLQKYRLGKQSGKEMGEQSKDASYLLDAPTSSSSLSPRVHTPDANEGLEVKEALRAQMEVQRRLHEQVEVQKHLQIRMDAHHKYIDSLLEKACRIAEQINASTMIGVGVDMVDGVDVPEVVMSSPYEAINPTGILYLPTCNGTIRVQDSSSLESYGLFNTKMPELKRPRPC